MEEKKCQKKFQGHHDASLYYSENNFRFSYGGVEINAVCHQDLLCSLFLCIYCRRRSNRWRHLLRRTEWRGFMRPWVTCPVLWATSGRLHFSKSSLLNFASTGTEGLHRKYVAHMVEVAAAILLRLRFVTSPNRRTYDAPSTNLVVDL